MMPQKYRPQDHDEQPQGPSPILPKESDSQETDDALDEILDRSSDYLEQAKKVRSTPQREGE